MARRTKPCVGYIIAILVLLKTSSAQDLDSWKTKGRNTVHDNKIRTLKSNKSKGCKSGTEMKNGTKGCDDYVLLGGAYLGSFAPSISSSASDSPASTFYLIEPTAGVVGLVQPLPVPTNADALTQLPVNSPTSRVEESGQPLSAPGSAIESTLGVGNSGQLWQPSKGSPTASRTASPTGSLTTRATGKCEMSVSLSDTDWSTILGSFRSHPSYSIPLFLFDVRSKFRALSVKGQLGDYGVCEKNIFFTYTFYNNGDSTLEELSAQRIRGGEGAEELNMEVTELNPGGKTIVTEIFFVNFCSKQKMSLLVNATTDPDCNGSADYVLTIEGSAPPALPAASPVAPPTTSPTASPYASPAGFPTSYPFASPATNIVEADTASPGTGQPGPTALPTAFPAVSPAAMTPTVSATASPIGFSTGYPIASPTTSLTGFPTASPTASLDGSPIGHPLASLTTSPTGSPTAWLTASPTGSPTGHPTVSATASPTVSRLTYLSTGSQTGHPTVHCFETQGNIEEDGGLVSSCKEGPPMDEPSPFPTTMNYEYFVLVTKDANITQVLASVEEGTHKAFTSELLVCHFPRRRLQANYYYGCTQVSSIPLDETDPNKACVDVLPVNQDCYVIHGGTTFVDHLLGTPESALLLDQVQRILVDNNDGGLLDDVHEDLLGLNFVSFVKETTSGTNTIGDNDPARDVVDNGANMTASSVLVGGAVAITIAAVGMIIVGLLVVRRRRRRSVPRSKDTLLDDGNHSSGFSSHGAPMVTILNDDLLDDESSHVNLERPYDLAQLNSCKAHDSERWCVSVTCGGICRERGVALQPAFLDTGIDLTLDAGVDLTVLYSGELRPKSLSHASSERKYAVPNTVEL